MAKEEIEHKKKRFVIFILLALLVAFLAVIMAQNAQDTADINNVFEVVVNNTNLAPSFVGEPPGTGERVTGTTYFANDSPIQLMVFAHASAAGGTATVEVWINNTMVQNQSGRPLAAPEQTFRSVAVIVPKFSSYSVNLSNYHHYEWREYPILSGKNGTISINQSLVGSSFNATYAANISALQANDTYFNSSIFNQSKNFRNDSIVTNNNTLTNMKVNKTGDTMTGRLCFNNCSRASLGELLVIQNSGGASTQGASLRVETNNTGVGNAFFGARYNGDRTDNQTPVLKDDVMFRMGGIGTKSNNTFSTASVEMRFVVDDNFTTNKWPGKIEFWTFPNRTTGGSIGKRWEIEANGSLTPANNNLYDIGNATSKVKNLSIALTAEGSTLDAVCYDGTKLFYNPGVATCTASRESFKHNITPAVYDPLKLNQFQLITYDYVVRYPHVDEVRSTVNYTEKTVKRYGLTAEQVEAIDPILVGHDEFGTPTGIHYEDLAAYLMNVTQEQQNKIDNICINMPSLCQQNPGILAKTYDSLKFVFA